ncbi:protein FAR1-RELATED SEQUENCE 5-like [Papaver somniferum]|uniref:protein FAR1-RELATED SEQUENCE 5-like n=1 Tax=Papaver somniferum TaxID=3469 RepID=UPI000E6F55EC|nr:protein FAR1-RELATED SEQUENCE 5-like [Papaver somniferum]
MSGKAPKEIVTDHAKAMQNVIKIVFPEARHRWCIWHIMKKLPDKFGVHKRFSNISFDMRVAVYDSQTPGEFEQLWDWMMEACDLGDHKWLTDLYEEMEMWVPGYLNIFRFEFALRDKVEKEKEADTITSLKSIPIITEYPMEKQNTILPGIKCVFNYGVKELPDKYILRRWRKDVKRYHTKVKLGFSCWKNDDASNQYYDLCNKFSEFADWVIGTSQYRDVDDWLGCKKKEVQQTFIKLKESEKLIGNQLEENIPEAVDGDIEYGVGDNVVISVNDPL